MPEVSLGVQARGSPTCETAREALPLVLKGTLLRGEDSTVAEVSGSPHCSGFAPLALGPFVQYRARRSSSRKRSSTSEFSVFFK